MSAKKNFPPEEPEEIISILPPAPCPPPPASMPDFDCPASSESWEDSLPLEIGGHGSDDPPPPRK